MALVQGAAPKSMKSLNTNNPSVKRIMKEYQQFEGDPSQDFVAAPLEDNIFEWHFTIKGPPDSEFEGGLYHGRILLPDQYPFKPPDIVMLTPSGRFEVNTKICLSITGFHPKNWQPSWGIRTVLLALSAFFPTDPKGAVGSLDLPKPDRVKLATRSRAWKCTMCAKANCDYFFEDAASAKPADPAAVPASPVQIPTPAPSTESKQAEPTEDKPLGTTTTTTTTTTTSSSMKETELHRRAVPAQPPSITETPQPQAQPRPHDHQHQHLHHHHHHHRRHKKDRMLSVITVIVSLVILFLLFRKFTRSNPALSFSFNS